jgi:hypothetical protein
LAARQIKSWGVEMTATQARANWNSTMTLA